MVELKYPRWWSFAPTDSFEGVKGTAVQKYNIIQKQLKFRLDRDLYIQARTYSEGPVNGGIDRFIEGMRKGFTIDEILDWKYDGIIDSDPRNRIIPTTPMPEVELLNDAIEVLPSGGYVSLEDLAKDIGKSLSTVKKWRNYNRVVKVGNLYFLNNNEMEEEPA